jgi:hypothetical protein
MCDSLQTKYKFFIMNTNIHYSEFYWTIKKYTLSIDN